MTRWTTCAAIAVICALLHADGAKAQNKETDAMLTLTRVVTTGWTTDGTALIVTLENGVRLEIGPAEKALDTDLWLRQTLQQGKPVGHDAETHTLLPATVVLSLEWVQTSGPSLTLFAPPRPGLVMLSRTSPRHQDLLAAIQAIMHRGDSAILALRGAGEIEDIWPLPTDAAERMLGFVPKPDAPQN